MKIVFNKLSEPDKEVKPTKKQIYHEQMVMAMRRRKYLDFKNALKDPKVIEWINKANANNPDWKPLFLG